MIINAFNLIDGLDGLASGLAIVPPAAWQSGSFLWARCRAVCMLILAGACLGFLRYNFYPARIFSGRHRQHFLELIFAIIGFDLDKWSLSLRFFCRFCGRLRCSVVLAIWRATRASSESRKRRNHGRRQDHLLIGCSGRQKSRRRRVLKYLMHVLRGIALLFLTLRAPCRRAQYDLVTPSSSSPSLLLEFTTPRF